MNVTLDARDLLRIVRENGGTLELAEALFDAAAQRLIRRRCERAIKAALFPATKMNEPSTVSPMPVEPSTPAPAAAPVAAPPQHGHARTMFLAMEGLARSGASSAAQRVGQLLLGRFDSRNGQVCFGYGAISNELGLSVRTVRRACAELDAPRPRRAVPRAGTRQERMGLGLILTVRHGGIGHANAFLPQIERLVALASAPAAGLGRSDEEPGAAKMNEPSTVAVSRPQRAVQPSTGGPQYNRRISTTGSGGEIGAGATPARQLSLGPLAGIVGGTESLRQRTAMAITQGDQRRRKRLHADLAAHCARLGSRQGALAWKELLPFESTGLAAERRASGSGLSAMLAASVATPVIAAASAASQATGPPPAARTVEVSAGLRRAMGR